MMETEDVEVLAGAIGSVAKALRNLGNGNASTDLGALEAFGMVIEEGCNFIAGGLHAVAEAINSLAGRE